MGRHGQGRVQPVVGHRRVRDLPQGQHPGPDGQGVVGLVVDGRAGADLGRDLVQGQGQDRGGGQLAAVAPADGGAAAGDDVVDQGPQGGVLMDYRSVTGRVGPMAIPDR
jgi:hypothetical protein